MTDDVTALFAEGPHQLAGNMGADAYEYARDQVLLDALEGSCRDAPKLACLELEPVLAVVSNRLRTRCTRPA